jgi:hypothetical protein
MTNEVYKHFPISHDNSFIHLFMHTLNKLVFQGVYSKPMVLWGLKQRPSSWLQEMQNNGKNRAIKMKYK